MSKFRQINTKIWDDAWFRSLKSQEKLLFIYLITNPLTELCGIYEITFERIGFDLGLNNKTIQKSFENFELSEKVFYINGWVYIKNFVKHHENCNPNMKKGIQRTLEDIPTEISSEISKINKGFKRLQKASDAFPPCPLPLPCPLPSPYRLQPAVAEEFVFSEKLKEMFNSKDRRMPIIAFYWTIKGFKFENKDKYNSALKRELRASADLKGYTNEEIKKTCQWLKDNSDFKWTLETVLKYIDEPLEDLKTGGKKLTDEDYIKNLKQKNYGKS